MNIRCLKEHEQRLHDFLLKKCNFLVDEVKQERIVCSKRVLSVWEGVLKRNDELSSLWELVGLKALIDSPWHVHELEDLVQVLLLVLLFLVILLDLLQVNPLAHCFLQVV